MTEETQKEENIKFSKRPRGYMTFLVLTMSVISLLDNMMALMDTAVIDIPLVGMTDDFGISSGDVRLWIAVYGLFAFLVFIIAWLNDALGRKKGLTILVLVIGVPAVLLPFTPSGPAGLHASMLLYGLLTLGTIANTWEIPITEEAPPKKRGILGAVAFLFGLLPIYALVGDDIAVALGSWKWSYAILGGILMVAALCLLPFMKETKRWLLKKNEIQNKRFNLLHSVKTLSRKDWKYVMLLIITYTVWGIVFKFGGLATQKLFLDHGWTSDDYQTVLTISGICLVFGALLAGIIMEKIGRHVTLIVGCVGSIASFILLGFTINPIFMVTLYFFMPVVLAYITVYYPETFPTEIRATCVGIGVAVSRSSYVVGPLLSGVLITALNLTPATTELWWIYWVVGGLLMILPMLSLLAKPYETKDQELEKILESR